MTPINVFIGISGLLFAGYSAWCLIRGYGTGRGGVPITGMANVINGVVGIIFGISVAIMGFLMHVRSHP